MLAISFGMIHHVQTDNRGVIKMVIPRIYGAARRQAKTLEQERIRNAAPALLEALEEFTEMYCDLVNSGDCGNWDPETDKEVIKARAAIAAARGTV